MLSHTGQVFIFFIFALFLFENFSCESIIKEMLILNLLGYKKNTRQVE
jgi:hypothetical protein